MDRVGVIGLGKMGLPIAMNLMSRGFHVTGYRRSGSPELVKAGGVVAASAAEVAAQADVILSDRPHRRGRRGDHLRSGRHPQPRCKKAPSTSR